MEEIWYLLKCPKGDETSYIEKYSASVTTGDIKEIICFQYQRMMRCAGTWHLEKRMVLPGYIFLLGTNEMALKRMIWEDGQVKRDIFLTPCETPYLKTLCQDGMLIGISKGIIKNQTIAVTSGPLKKREWMIRKIDRHKRTAEIEIPLIGNRKRITVGLEIYRKEI